MQAVPKCWLRQTIFGNMLTTECGAARHMTLLSIHPMSAHDVEYTLCMNWWETYDGRVNRLYSLSAKLAANKKDKHVVVNTLMYAHIAEAVPRLWQGPPNVVA